jgi:hypothetical protein
VKDRALSELYRTRYPSCHRQYSLSVPFMERFFDLAIKGDGTTQQPVGFVGQITANSFMKREFGKKLIEEYLPSWDLTHVIDTSGAHIPGHNAPGEGTTTLIILGKNQLPKRDTIRTVLGIRGEPTVPENPAEGLVWQAILRQVELPGSQSEWMSATDSPRVNFEKHPWSIGGGGAAELKQMLDKACEVTLENFIQDVGRTTHTGEDDAFIVDLSTARRRWPTEFYIDFVKGEDVRHFAISCKTVCLFPYDRTTALRLNQLPRPLIQHFWPLRTLLRHRRDYGQFIEERGLAWWEHSMFFRKRLLEPVGVAFPFVATHNHFVLNRSMRVFNRHAPLIQLKPAASVSHKHLFGLLNSSTACFWARQIFQGKGGFGGGKWEERIEWDGGKLLQLPIPLHPPGQLPAALDQSSASMQSYAPATVLATKLGEGAQNFLAERKEFCLPGKANSTFQGHSSGVGEGSFTMEGVSSKLEGACSETKKNLCTTPSRLDLREVLATARVAWHSTRRHLIAWQEELDWQIYDAFGLVESADGLSLPEDIARDATPEIEFGERAFEFTLARRLAAGEEQTTWFERHGAVPRTELPTAWPPEYRALVERRICRITEDANLRLIERPECKRRWNAEPWDQQLTRALRDWLLNRLETAFFEGERILGQEDRGCPAPESARTTFPASREPRLTSTRQLADAMSLDADFLRVAVLYRDREDFDLPKLVRELVEEESVPFLPAQRYKESGLRKRMQWEQTWDLQRLEDEIDARRAAQATRNAAGQPSSATQGPMPEKPEVPVPPKYASADFKKASYWRLRGKLDVPKERWMLYPGAERQGDPAPVIAWAGWDHKQQAQALAAYYQERKDQDGWTADRLAPLLAGLKDLVPWLKQWHNEIDPAYGLRLGDFYEEFVRSETHALGLSEAQVEAIRIGC